MEEELKEEKKKRKLNIYQEIIERLVDVPTGSVKAFWPREVKLAKDLLKSMPDVDFWRNVTFGRKLKSLSGLKTEFGKETLENKIREWNYVPPKLKELPLEKTEKIGKDTIRPTKKSLLEML